VSESIAVINLPVTPGPEQGRGERGGCLGRQFVGSAKIDKYYTRGPRYLRGLRSKNYPQIPKSRITREDLLVLKL